MKNCRCPFDEAVESFKGFLKSQNWSTELLWLSRDRIVSKGREFFVFRPKELTSDKASRTYYEELRKTESNIHIDGLGQLENHTLAYVSKEGGESRLLNFSIPSSDYRIDTVHFGLLWKLALRARKKSKQRNIMSETLKTITPEPDDGING